MSDDNTLEHFGVRGMHWGVHKKQSTESLSPEEQHQRNVKKGKITAGVALAAYAAVRITPVIATYTRIALNSRANGKLAADGAKATADLFANSRGLTNYSAINLAFNGAKGLWE